MFLEERRRETDNKQTISSSINVLIVKSKKRCMYFSPIFLLEHKGESNTGIPILLFRLWYNGLKLLIIIHN